MDFAVLFFSGFIAGSLLTGFSVSVFCVILWRILSAKAHIQREAIHESTSIPPVAKNAEKSPEPEFDEGGEYDTSDFLRKGIADLKAIYPELRSVYD